MKLTDVQKKLVEQLLLTVINHESIVEYNELAKRINPPIFQRQVGREIGEVSKLCKELGLPLLSAKVITRGSRTAGAGFYKLMSELGINTKGKSENELFTQELKKIRDCKEWYKLADYLNLDLELPRLVQNNDNDISSKMKVGTSQESSGNFNEVAADVVMTAISNSEKPSALTGKVTANKYQTKPPVANKTLKMQIAEFNKYVHDGEAEQVAMVKQFVSAYTVQKLQNLSKEDYVYGSGRKDTFCYRVTHELREWGSIRNGTPTKYGLYYDPNQNKFCTVSKFGKDDTEEEVNASFNNVKFAICQLIIDGGNENYEALLNNQLSTIFKGKLLCIYFPEKYINIYSLEHMKFYMGILGIAYNESDNYLNWLKQVIDWKNNDPVAKKWTNHEFSKFLYHGIGYMPDSEKHKKEVRKQEKKIDDEYLDEIDEISSVEIPTDDAYVPVPEDRKDPVINGENYSYPRDKKTALKALKRANYKCQIDKDHPSFIRKTNGTNYTEPHHLVPMSEQDNYEKSLDVQANIVSLCSNCHNQLHYGKDTEALLRKLYEVRQDELEAAGIIISFEELLGLYK